MPCGGGQGFVGTAGQAGSVRTAYRCRAYPDAAQQAMLNRTFGCARVVWNCILAARQQRYVTQRTGTSYGQASAALTAMKKDPQRAWLNEVSCVPLQQALRHQQRAFAAFFAGRARYPRFKSRHGRQAAEYTRSAFTLRNGELRLAKTPGPLAFVWSWPDVDVAGLDPTTVFVSKEPDGRWYVTFAVEAAAPAPLPGTGHAVGVDLGVTSFAVISDGQRIANPRHLERRARNLARYQRRLARCQNGSGPPGPAATQAQPACRWRSPANRCVISMVLDSSRCRTITMPSPMMLARQSRRGAPTGSRSSAATCSPYSASRRSRPSWRVIRPAPSARLKMPAAL